MGPSWRARSAARLSCDGPQPPGFTHAVPSGSDLGSGATGRREIDGTPDEGGWGESRAGIAGAMADPQRRRLQRKRAGGGRGGDRARARARPGVRGSAIGQPVPRRSGGTRYRGKIRHNQYCAKSPQSRTKRIAWRIRPTRTEACWDRDDGRWKGGGSWRGAKPARTSSHGTMRDEERR